jgi:Spy/CpxP family protein refolding chaperone
LGVQWPVITTFFEESEGLMRRFLGIAVPVLAACLLTADLALAQGQGPGRRGGPFGGMQAQPAMLLQNPQVQKELKLMDEQIAKIKEIADAYRPQPGAFANIQNMSEEERREFFAEMQKKGEEAGKKLTEVLTDAQNARFKQIQLWIQGTMALVQNEELGKKLEITDDQKAALKTITEESAKKGRDIRGFGPGSSEEERAEARKQFNALRTETEAECMAVLTDDQKAQFEKLRGPKFELDFSQMFNRRGRGGQPGGNNN